MVAKRVALNDPSATVVSAARAANAAMPAYAVDLLAAAPNVRVGGARTPA